MTVFFVQGDLPQANIEALANAVNCADVMGKGIVLAVRYRLPANFRMYVSTCQQAQVQTGTMFGTRRDTWQLVRTEIERALGDWPMDIRVFEPLDKVRNSFAVARNASAGTPQGRI